MGKSFQSQKRVISMDMLSGEIEDYDRNKEEKKPFQFMTKET